jgi:hypothetical protein
MRSKTGVFLRPAAAHALKARRATTDTPCQLFRLYGLRIFHVHFRIQRFHHDYERRFASAGRFDIWPRLMKYVSPSSTDHGGGKRRSIIAVVSRQKMHKEGHDHNPIRMPAVACMVPNSGTSFGPNPVPV